MSHRPRGRRRAEVITVLALISVFLFLISFVLYWAGKGTAPLDWQGFAILGLIFLALHQVWAVWPPALRSRPPSA